MPGPNPAERSFDDLVRIAEEVVRETLSGLPKELRQHANDIPVFFESVPAPDDEEAGVDPGTLGFFDPGPDEAPMFRIRLWLDNLWDYAGFDEGTFREEVAITILHELGHALGWDEEEIDERGLG